MNISIRKSVKGLFQLRILSLCVLLLIFLETSAQVVTISAASGGLSTPPLTGGTTNHAIFGVQLAKDAVAANTVTAISFGLSSDPTGKFTNARLYESTDATFSGVGTEVLVTAGVLSATNVTFTGAPLTNFDGATTAIDNEFFFVVVDVAAGATGTIQPSLTTAGVTVSTSTVSGSTITGTMFDFLTADFTQNADDGSALADENDVTLLDFTVNSNGTQSLSAPLVITFDTNVTGILENWDLQVGGVNILGAETYTLNGPGTQLTIDLFTAVDVTNATTFTLLADIQAGAVSANDFIVTLASAGVTISPGIPEAFAPFTNSVDVTGLEADFTQNADDATALADENDVTLLDFTVNSNGTQSINSTLTFTFNTNITSILENFDLQVGGVNIAGAETYPLSGGGTILTVTGFSSVDVTNATTFTLLADIQSGATSANDFTVSLAPSGVNISPGISEVFGTFSNDINVTGLEADFTQNVDDATALADENDVTLLDFTVNSNGTQSINSTLTFTFNTNITSILENFDLQVGGVNIAGAETYPLSGGGTILTVTGFSSVDVTNATTFTLLADIQAGATVSNDFTITLIPGNVTIAPGIVEPFVSFSNSIDIVTSQLSEIILNGETTDNINYIAFRAPSIDDDEDFKSVSLARLQIRDGAGVDDPDDKGTTLTDLEIQLNSNWAMVRKIALFDGGNEIAGTEQTVTGPTITFSGLSLSTSDGAGGTNNFNIRVTFQNDVTDNVRIHVTVTDATAASTGSGFATANAGGATTTGVAAPANQIEVGPAALSLAFTGNPPNTAIFTNFSLTVEARDAQGNVDEDYTRQVALTEDGPGALSVSGGQSLTPFLVAGVYNWTTLQASQSGTYNLLASDDPYDDDFANATGTVIITATASSITQGTLPAPPVCYGTSFQTLTNIVIDETDNAGISGTPGSYTFSIALPSGFVFDQTVTAGVSTTGGSDITIPAAPHYSYPSANVVQFSFNLVGTANDNQIIISGLKVGHPHPGTVSPPATGSVDITRSGGTANIAGVVPGTDLGTVSASQQGAGTASFTVATVSGGAIDPNTTSFNVNSGAIELVPNPSTGTILFTCVDGGITFVSGEYRFNPSSLGSGTYEIVFTHTDASGCQTIAKKDFVVFESGINNLDPSYCDNAAVSPLLTVNQTFLDQVYSFDPPGTWQVDNFVYYDPPPPYGTNLGWIKITSPDNTHFNPTLPIYKSASQWFNSIGLPGVAVGIAVCNNGTVPCNGNSTTGWWDAYQHVQINTSPSPSFTISKTQFCLDDPAVVLTGNPPNSDATSDDFFTGLIPPYGPTDVAPAGTVAASVPPTNKVWSFTPSALGGAGTVRVTYTYKDPGTLCSGTSAPTILTVNTRPGTVTAGTITSPGGTAPETCQGVALVTFTTSPALTSPNEYRWYSDAALTTLEGVGNSFNPPNPPYDLNVPTPVGVPHDWYITQYINGCESNKQLSSPPPARLLTATVKPSPAAPVPNFSDTPDREFCVAETINAATLVVPGTSVNWFDVNNFLTFSGNNPNTADLNIITPTVSDTVYTFEVTQTVSLCESPRTSLRVTIKSLPNVSINPGTADPMKICTTGPLITFQGSDEDGIVTTGSWTTVGPGFTGGALVPAGGAAFLTTTSLVPDNYTLRFDHTNSAGCSNFATLPLRVVPKVNLSLTPLDSCDGIFVRLNNTSTLQTGPSTTVAVSDLNISSTEWDFNDGLTTDAGTGNIPLGTHGGDTRATYLSPEHYFQNLGSKSVKYTMITTDGSCTYVGTELLTVNAKPKIDFGWTNVCLDSVTNLSSTVFLAAETTTPTPLPISQYFWDFTVNGTLAHASAGTGVNPTVQYNVEGSDLAELIVVTTSQCRDTIQKPIYIVPTYSAIKLLNAYAQDFELNSNGWIDGGMNSLWTLGFVAGDTILSDASTGAASWFTGPEPAIVPIQSSWVMSGCFDFSGAVKPVIAFDIWSDTPDGLDGAVLQYNTSGNIEDDNEWEVIGTQTAGINWYDDNGIANSPGNQSSGDIGWTGTYSGWKRAIYSLDTYVANETSPVVFRIAFASAQGRQDGFAFDNAFIGERTRVVLVENFTNSSLVDADYNDHNAEYNDFGNSAEVVKIQYHTAFPELDQLNAMNDQMNNSRAAFYGITSAPTFRIDGQVANSNANAQSIYDNRVLTPATVGLRTTATYVGPHVEIRTTVKNNSSQTIQTTGAHLFTAIVEKTIDDVSLLGSSGNSEFKYVAKSMLPSPSGLEIDQDIAPGDSIIMPVVIWDDMKLINPDSGAIVVFVQNIGVNNKNVAQANILNVPTTIPDVVTGIEDPAYAEKINLYPNPANHELNIELPAAVRQPTAVTLTDAFGRAVYLDTFGIGEYSKTVNTTGLAGGIYIVQISTPEGNIARRKVMVVHR